MSRESADLMVSTDDPNLLIKARPTAVVPHYTLQEHVRRFAAQRPFVVFMILVMSLTAFYYGLISARLYVSETRFAIRSTQVVAPTGILAGLIGQPTGLSDITAVSDYIGSPDMLKILEARHHLREMYSRPRADLLQWLPANASQEDFLGFYRRHVVVKLDREANTVIVQVRSFTPESALAIGNSVVELTGNFVDGQSQRMRTELMSAAKSELAHATVLAENERRNVERFRSASADIDPSQSGAMTVSAVATGEGAIAQAKSELASLLTYSQPNSPAVRQLQAKINTLSAQVAALKAKQSNQAQLSKKVTDFETAQLNRANAEKTLALAQAAYDQARANAEQRDKFVVKITSPNLPEAATYPNRILEFITVLIFAMAGYALVSLTVLAIRDHRGV